MWAASVLYPWLLLAGGAPQPRCTADIDTSVAKSGSSFDDEVSLLQVWSGMNLDGSGDSLPQLVVNARSGLPPRQGFANDHGVPFLHSGATAPLWQVPVQQDSFLNGGPPPFQMAPDPFLSDTVSLASVAADIEGQLRTVQEQAAGSERSQLLTLQEQTARAERSRLRTLQEQAVGAERSQLRAVQEQMSGAERSRGANVIAHSVSELMSLQKGLAQSTSDVGSLQNVVNELRSEAEVGKRNADAQAGLLKTALAQKQVSDEAVGDARRHVAMLQRRADADQAQRTQEMLQALALAKDAAQRTLQARQSEQKAWEVAKIQQGKAQSASKEKEAVLGAMKMELSSMKSEVSRVQEQAAEELQKEVDQARKVASLKLEEADAELRKASGQLQHERTEVDSVRNWARSVQQEAEKKVTWAVAAQEQATKQMNWASAAQRDVATAATAIERVAEVQQKQ